MSAKHRPRSSSAVFYFGYDKYFLPAPAKRFNAQIKIVRMGVDAIEDQKVLGGYNNLNN